MTQSAALRFVIKPFPARLNPAVAEGVFARLDDHLQAEIDRLERLPSSDDTPFVIGFYKWALQQLDADAYADLQTRILATARHDPAIEDVAKFLNLTFYAKNKIPQLRRLGLHEGPKKRILDVGCGPGHLQLIAQYFGHDAEGFDLPFPSEHPYSELCKFFGVTKSDHRVTAFHPLPDYPEPFDFVTIFLAGFNRDDEGLWGANKWRFFIDDVRTRLLRPGGGVYVTLTTGRWTEDGWLYLASASEWTRNNRIAFIRA